MKKTLLPLLSIAALLLLGLSPSLPSTEKPWMDGETPKVYFSDVETGQFYSESVAFAIYDGWEDAGYKFYPSDGRTRGELAEMILRANHETLLTDFEAIFVDVPLSHPRAPYIYTGVKRGYWRGYTDGSNKFGADDTLMRVHLAVILSNMLPVSYDTDADKSYLPVDEYPSWGIEAIQIMRGIGSMRGKGDTGIEWGALDKLNRAESLTAVFRIFGPYSEYILIDEGGSADEDDAVSDDDDVQVVVEDEPAVDDTTVPVDTGTDADDAQTTSDAEPEPEPAVTFNQANATWTVETLVDSGTSGRFSSLAIDKDGKLHAAHMQMVTSGDEKLMYMTNKSGSWVSEVISPVQISVYSAIVVDSSGGVHVAYYETEGGSFDLKYAYKQAGGSFSITAVDQTGTVGQYTDLALDANGKAYISYLDVSNSTVKLATNKSGSFSTEIIDTNIIPADTSVAVDVSGNVHIAYTGVGFALKYASKNASGSSWSLESVDSQGRMSYADLVLDSNGKPHIAYFYAAGGSGSDGALMYTNKTGGSWAASKVVDDQLTAGEYAALAIDGSGKAYVAYHVRAINSTGLNAQLKFATNFSGSFVTKSIDEGVDSEDNLSGEFNSIVLESSGRAYITYHYGYTSDFKLAKEN